MKEDLIIFKHEGKASTLHNKLMKNKNDNLKLFSMGEKM